MRTATAVDWRNRCALLRADLNAPLTDGAVSDDSRLAAVVPTILHILNGGGGVSLLSHFGRPSEGVFDDALSTRPLAPLLGKLLSRPVRFCEQLQKAAAGEVLLLENTRFNIGELANDATLAQRYAACGDVFVMDAFATAHRAEASVSALAQTGMPTCAGLLLEKELTALARLSQTLRRPLVGVFGGAKISTKLHAIRRMAGLCDTLIAGGGIANTLLLAQGFAIGKSLAQPDMLDDAQKILHPSQASVLLPEDVVVAADARADAQQTRQVDIDAVGAEDKIFDVGEKTRQQYATALAGANTILWNGPVGLFEHPPFAGGTAALAKAIGDSSAFSVAGGGDTISAAKQFGVFGKLSHVSTGGGALLEFLAGAKLPGLAAFAV